MRKSYDFSNARKNPYIEFLPKASGINLVTQSRAEKLKVFLLQLFKRALK
jgi:hypothetical protein